MDIARYFNSQKNEIVVTNSIMEMSQKKKTRITRNKNQESIRKL